MDLLEVVAVGLPFCGFKVLAGLALTPFSRILGLALVGLGVLDGLINAVNLVWLCVRRRRALDACFLAFATRPFRRASGHAPRWHDFGNSLDVLLSFALVALMIGGGFLREMPSHRLTLWNACVILNVLGAGLLRFSSSLRGLADGA